MRSPMIALSASIVALVMLIAASAIAQSSQDPQSAPDVMTIVDKMKEVFEPKRPRMATVTVTLSGQDGVETKWVAHQARKASSQGKRAVLVMAEPEGMKGNALLVRERKDKPDDSWLYLPVINRVRKVVPVESYQRFFESDFTYADLGFIDRAGEYRLLGKEEHNGVQTYKIELKPNQQWYYSRIVTWADADSYLPVQRNYYDRTGTLWKTQIFDEITTIEGVPTALRIEMRDVLQDASTTFMLSDVRYDGDIPEEVFDPERLPQVADLMLRPGDKAQLAAEQSTEMKKGKDKDGE